MGDRGDTGVRDRDGGEGGCKARDASGSDSSVGVRKADKSGADSSQSVSMGLHKACWELR